MIIACEKCKTKFNLDENLLNVKGSKVRCSICEHVFVAYPPEAPVEGAVLEPDNAFQSTQALDSKTAFEDDGTEFMEDTSEPDFEMEFEESAEEETSEEEAQDQVSADEALHEEEIAVEPEDVIEPFAEKEEVRPRAREVTSPRKKSGPSRRFPVILLIILLLLAGGAGAIYFFAPELIPESLNPASKNVADPGIRRLSFDGVNGLFLTSEKAGRLFVIKGNVINNYPKSRSFILIKGTLLDDKGQTVETKSVYAGNIFSEQQIEEMSLEEIDDGLKNREGKGNMNVNLGPGSSIPFMIILGNLPQNLSEFTVEAVSSSPGE